MGKLIGLLLLYFSFHHLLIVRDNCDSGLVECAPKLTHFFHPSLLLRLYVGWEPVLKVSLYQYVCTHLGLLSVPDTNCHYAFLNSCSLKYMIVISMAILYPIFTLFLWLLFIKLMRVSSGFLRKNNFLYSIILLLFPLPLFI
jgi:hypothetical protein